MTTTLRPGLLVSLKTSLRGNVSYNKRDIEPEHQKGTVLRATWETERTIADAEEFKLASKVRSEAAYCVSRVCASTAFGYLCPDDRASDLEDAVRTAHGMVDDFNRTARITRLSLNLICGRVAPDDVEAVRAIRSEMSDLIADMTNGVEALSPDKVRDAAARAKQLSAMLTDASKNRAEEAIKAARNAANAMAKAVRAGEQAAEAIDAQVLAKLAGARTAFLDLDAGDSEPAETAPVAPRAIDLDSEPTSIAASAEVRPSLDLF